MNASALSMVAPSGAERIAAPGQVTTHPERFEIERGYEKVDYPTEERSVEMSA